MKTVKVTLIAIPLFALFSVFFAFLGHKGGIYVDNEPRVQMTTWGPVEITNHWLTDADRAEHKAAKDRYYAENYQPTSSIRAGDTITLSCLLYEGEDALTGNPITLPFEKTVKVLRYAGKAKLCPKDQAELGLAKPAPPEFTGRPMVVEFNNDGEKTEFALDIFTPTSDGRWLVMAAKGPELYTIFLQ